MHRQIAPGLRHTPALHMNPMPATTTQPPVFATALLVGLVEWACIEALQPYLQPGETTMGSHVYLSHRAPRPVDMERVTATAELVEVRGNTVRFRVDCFDAQGRIGSGFHERSVMDAPRCAAA